MSAATTATTDVAIAKSISRSINFLKKDILKKHHHSHSTVSTDANLLRASLDEDEDVVFNFSPDSTDMTPKSSISTISLPSPDPLTPKIQILDVEGADHGKESEEYGEPSSGALAHSPTFAKMHKDKTALKQEVTSLKGFLSEIFLNQNKEDEVEGIKKVKASIESNQDYEKIKEDILNGINMWEARSDERGKMLDDLMTKCHAIDAKIEMMNLRTSKIQIKGKFDVIRRTNSRTELDMAYVREVEAKIASLEEEIKTFKARDEELEAKLQEVERERDTLMENNQEGINLRKKVEEGEGELEDKTRFMDNGIAPLQKGENELEHLQSIIADLKNVISESESEKERFKVMADEKDKEIEAMGLGINNLRLIGLQTSQPLEEKKEQDLKPEDGLMNKTVTAPHSEEYENATIQEMKEWLVEKDVELAKLMAEIEALNEANKEISATMLDLQQRMDDSEGSCAAKTVFIRAMTLKQSELDQELIQSRADHQAAMAEIALLRQHSEEKEGEADKEASLLKQIVDARETQIAERENDVRRLSEQLSYLQSAAGSLAGSRLSLVSLKKDNSDNNSIGKVEADDLKKEPKLAVLTKPTTRVKLLRDQDANRRASRNSIISLLDTTQIDKTEL
eukprot:Ihof_evm8s21 gene=Ihof_evmTU8s21